MGVRCGTRISPYGKGSGDRQLRLHDRICERFPRFGIGGMEGKDQDAFRRERIPSPSERLPETRAEFVFGIVALWVYRVASESPI
jgi:hypothetical protein